MTISSDSKFWDKPERNAFRSIASAEAGPGGVSQWSEEVEIARWLSYEL